MVCEDLKKVKGDQIKVLVRILGRCEKDVEDATEAVEWARVTPIFSVADKQSLLKAINDTLHSEDGAGTDGAGNKKQSCDHFHNYMSAKVWDVVMDARGNSIHVRAHTMMTHAHSIGLKYANPETRKLMTAILTLADPDAKGLTGNQAVLGIEPSKASSRPDYARVNAELQHGLLQFV